MRDGTRLHLHLEFFVLDDQRPKTQDEIPVALKRLHILYECWLEQRL